MKHRLKVGTGFGKYSFDKALSKSKLGDTLVFDPGEYILNSQIEINDLTFVGSGADPSKVVIRGSFYLSDQNSIVLQNLTLASTGGHNTLGVEKNSQVTAENVIFIGSGNGYPTIYLDHSKVHFSHVEIHNNFEKDQGICALNNSQLELDQSDIYYCYLEESWCQIQSSQIRRCLYLNEHAEVQADEIYLADMRDETFLLFTQEGVLLSSDYLDFPAGTSSLKTIDSKIVVGQTNLKDDHQAVLYKNGADQVEIPGASVRLLDQQQSQQANNNQQAEHEEPQDQPAEDDSQAPEQTEKPAAEEKAKQHTASDQLEQLIGIESVKKDIKKFINLSVFSKKRVEKGLKGITPSLHSVFLGRPGTGKTTVARIIAQLFYSLGILAKDTVSEVSRTDLVGQYIGQTETKTAKAIRNAMGGVLFVDEAYQLTQLQTANDFGKQAVETFVTELENHRDQFITIFAGYTKEMQQFLDENPGLRSRVPLYIEFDSYTAEEVAQIVVNLITKDWQVNTALLKEVVEQLYEAVPQNKRSNGRWARNYAERLINAHKVWLGQQDNVANVKQITDGLIEASRS